MAIEKMGKVLLNIYQMHDEVKELGAEVKGLANEVRGIDRRVIRIETMVEVAQKHSSQTISALLEGAEQSAPDQSWISPVNSVHLPRTK
jgi:cell division septum initiation protein DivIVA